MATVFSSFTVVFEEPFWVGVYTRECGRKYEVCKITFGAEPKDYEIYDFLLKNYDRLKFSTSVSEANAERKEISPKRRARLIKKQLEPTGVGTKAQQALKLSYEQNKLQKKSQSKQRREMEKERKFSLHIEKKKEKHKGR